MNNPKSSALKGMHNQRINQTTGSGNEMAAARTDAGRYEQKTNVTIPSSSGVENAKDWVDNGSRL